MDGLKSLEIGCGQHEPFQECDGMKPLTATDAVTRYGAIIEHQGSAIVDTSKLPLPKAEMKKALIAVWRSTTDEKLPNAVEFGYVNLANFQDGVGDKPIDGKFAKDADAATVKAALDPWLAWSPKIQAEMGRLNAEREELKRTSQAAAAKSAARREENEQPASPPRARGIATAFLDRFWLTFIYLIVTAVTTVQGAFKSSLIVGGAAFLGCALTYVGVAGVVGSYLARREQRSKARNLVGIVVVGTVLALAGIWLVSWSGFWIGLFGVDIQGTYWALVGAFVALIATKKSQVM
jgi:hypothetical protein